MNGKKSFIAYNSWGDIFQELNNQQAGKLIKAIFDYQNNGDYKLDKTLSLVFISFKQTLDRDNEKYESICERNKNNGKKGGRPTSKKKPTKPTGLFGNPVKPKKPDSDSDSESDNDNKTITNVIEDKPLVTYGNPEINEGMELLSALTETKTPPKSKLNRYALKRLYAKYGKDRTLEAVKMAFEAKYSDNYAPRVHNYMDLEVKWEALRTYFLSRREGGDYDATNL